MLLDFCPKKNHTLSQFAHTNTLQHNTHTESEANLSGDHGGKLWNKIHDLFCKTKCLSFDFLEQRTRKQLYTSSYKYYLLQRKVKGRQIPYKKYIRCHTSFKNYLNIKQNDA